MVSAVRVVTGTFLDDTTPILLAAADRTDLPTAAIVIASTGEFNNVVAFHLSLSFGVTDFITSAAVAIASEDNESPSQTIRKHVTGKIMSIVAATDQAAPFTILRSATAAAYAGGILLTPDQAGTEYRVHAILFFEHKFEAFNTAGDGSYSTDESIIIPHTLGSPARFGLFAGVNAFNAELSIGSFTIGMFRDAGAFDEINPNSWNPFIEQSNVSFRFKDNVNPTSTAGRSVQDRIASQCNNTGGEFSGQEITDNDISQLQITNRSGGATNVGLIGLLSTMPANSTHVGFLNAPTNAAVDWVQTSVPFEPEAMFSVLTMMDSFPFGAASANAAVFGFYAMDALGSEGSISFIDEYGVATSDASSQSADDMNFLDHTNATAFRLSNVTFTSDGYICTAANVITANATQRKFLTALFGKPTIQIPPFSTIERVGLIDDLNVIYDNEVLVGVYGFDFTGSGVVTLSDYEVAGAGSGTEVTQLQTSYTDTLIVITAVDKGALIGDALWINVTPTGENTASFPIICRADPGAGNLALRGTPGQTQGEEGELFSFPAGNYVYAGYLASQDVLTITVLDLPPGLTISSTGLITGTIATGAVAGSPYQTEATATDLALNSVTDPFVWTVGASADLGWEDDDAPWGGVELSSKDFAPVYLSGTMFFILGYDRERALPARLERRGLIYVNGQGLIGRAIHPQIIGPTGFVVQLSLGAHDTPDGPITWEGPYDFVVGTDEYRDFDVFGKYLAVRFESIGAPVWTLQSFSVDFATTGEH